MPKPLSNVSNSWFQAQNSFSYNSLSVKLFLFLFLLLSHNLKHCFDCNHTVVTLCGAIIQISRIVMIVSADWKLSLWICVFVCVPCVSLYHTSNWIVDLHILNFLIHVYHQNTKLHQYKIRSSQLNSPNSFLVTSSISPFLLSISPFFRLFSLIYLLFSLFILLIVSTFKKNELFTKY